MVVIQDIVERDLYRISSGLASERPFLDRRILRVWLTRLLVGIASRPVRSG